MARQIGRGLGAKRGGVGSYVIARGRCWAWALGAVAGRFVVDIGCGAGACSVDLAGRGARVLGVDLSADLLEVARGRSRGLDVSYHCGDVVALARGGGLTGAEALFSRCGTMFFDDQAEAWDAIVSGLGESRISPTRSLHVR